MVNKLKLVVGDGPLGGVPWGDGRGETLKHPPETIETAMESTSKQLDSRGG